MKIYLDRNVDRGTMMKVLVFFVLPAYFVTIYFFLLQKNFYKENKCATTTATHTNSKK